VGGRLVSVGNNLTHLWESSLRPLIQKGRSYSGMGEVYLHIITESSSLYSMGEVYLYIITEWLFIYYMGEVYLYYNYSFSHFLHRGRGLSIHNFRKFTLFWCVVVVSIVKFPYNCLFCCVF